MEREERTTQNNFYSMVQHKTRSLQREVLALQRKAKVRTKSAAEQCFCSIVHSGVCTHDALHCFRRGKKRNVEATYSQQFTIERQLRTKHAIVESTSCVPRAICHKKEQATVPHLARLKRGQYTGRTPLYQDKRLRHVELARIQYNANNAQGMATINTVAMDDEVSLPHPSRLRPLMPKKCLQAPLLGVDVSRHCNRRRLSCLLPKEAGTNKKMCHGK